MLVQSIKNVAILLGHTVVAVIGTALVTDVLWKLFRTHSVGGVIRKELILSFICSSAIGFLMYGMCRSRLGIWAWVLPTMWFALGMLSLLPSGGLWDQLSGADCVNGPNACRYFFLFTVPFVRSIAYSVGTLVGLRVLPTRTSNEAAPVTPLAGR